MGNGMMLLVGLVALLVASLGHYAFHEPDDSAIELIADEVAEDTLHIPKCVLEHCAKDATSPNS